MDLFLLDVSLGLEEGFPSESPGRLHAACHAARDRKSGGGRL
jgi:hypothetical protein